MFLLHALTCMAAALLLAPSGQAPPQSPPQPAVRTPPEQGTPAAATAKPRRQRTGRQTRTGRMSRSSPRRAGWPGAPNFSQDRTSRVAGPTRQELTFTSNVLVGYDDNLTAGQGTARSVVPAAMVSGPTRSMETTLGYFRGNTHRSIQVDSAGDLRSYPGYLDKPAPGGTVTVGARTTIGRDLTLRGSERAAYQPLLNVFSLGAAGGLLPRDAPQSNRAAGLLEKRSLSSSTSVSVDRRWSRQDWTTLSYSGTRQHFIDDREEDSNSHNLQVEYRRAVARSVRARAGYKHVRLDRTTGAVSLPTRQNWIEAGTEIDPQVSSRHPLTLSLNVGASYIESVDSRSRKRYDEWVPIGNARANVGLSTSWSIEAGYDRGFSLLAGVTNDVYTTGTAYLSAGGLLNTRTDLRLGGTYSSGRVPLASGVDERMMVNGASIQVRVSLTDGLAAFGSYSYYQHHFSNPAALPTGFPERYDRNAVRVGLTVWLPRGRTRSPRIPQS